MQRRQQIRLRPLRGPEAALPEFAVQRNQRDKHEANGGKMAETRDIIGAVRIDQRVDIGEHIARLVMVDHHDAHAEFFRLGQRLEARGTAVDRDQQRRAFGSERLHRFGVRPVALKQSVGNVDQRVESGVAQVPGEQRRRGCAVDIVVAEDGDALAGDDGVGDALRRRLHLRHRERIRQRAADRRVKELVHRVELDAAPGNHPRQHFRQIVALRHR